MTLNPINAGDEVVASDLDNNFQHNRKELVQYTAGEAISEGDAVCIKADGQVYIADETDDILTNFVGFADEGVSSGNSIDIQTSGVRSGFSLNLNESITETSFFSNGGATAGEMDLYENDEVGNTIYRQYIPTLNADYITKVGIDITLISDDSNNSTWTFTMELLDSDGGSVLASDTKDVSSTGSLDFSFNQSVTPKSFVFISLQLDNITNQESGDRIRLRDYDDSSGGKYHYRIHKDDPNVEGIGESHWLGIDVYTNSKVYARKGEHIWLGTSGNVTTTPSTRAISVGRIIDSNTIAVNARTPRQRIKTVSKSIEDNYNRNQLRFQWPHNARKAIVRGQSQTISDDSPYVYFTQRCHKGMGFNVEQGVMDGSSNPLNAVLSSIGTEYFEATGNWVDASEGNNLSCGFDVIFFT